MDGGALQSGRKRPAVENWPAGSLKERHASASPRRRPCRRRPDASVGHASTVHAYRCDSARASLKASVALLSMFSAACSKAMRVVLVQRWKQASASKK